MRIGQTSFIAFASKFLSAAAGFAATIYFARELGDEVLGIYFFLLSIVGWLALLGTMGVGSAITKRMSEGKNVAEYKGAGGVVILGFGILISLLLLLFRPSVATILGVDIVEYVVVLLLVGLLGTYVDSMLQGDHLVHVYAMLKPVRRIIRTALQIGAVLLGWELAGLVFGYAVGGIVVVAIGLVYVGGNYALPGREHVDSVFEYARYAWMGNLEGKTFNQADILLLGFLVPAGAVGVYGVTWNIAAFLILFSTAVSSAIFPEISKLSENDETESISSIVRDSIAYAGLFAIPGLVGGLLLAEEILAVYGSAFDAGSQILGFLLLSVVFYSYQKQFVNTLGAIDRPDEAFKINLVLIVSNVILNVVLITLYGITGAAIATAASTVISGSWGFVLLRRHVETAIPVGEVGRQVIAAFGMGALLIGLQPLLEGTLISQYPLAHAGTLVSMGAMTYFLLLLGLSGDFRGVVRNNLPNGVL